MGGGRCQKTPSWSVQPRLGKWQNCSAPRAAGRPLLPAPHPEPGPAAQPGFLDPISPFSLWPSVQNFLLLVS